MSREVLDIVRGTDMDEFDRQIAMQCAPLIAGLVVSNILTIDEEYTDRVRELFLGTDISLITLIAKRGRISFFLYREKKLAEYLKDDEVVELLYNIDLNYITSECGMLENFIRRYREYMIHGGYFPHEMGVFLGYPIEDVKGFIENEGRDSLYTGYWKVYKNVPAKIRLFERFEQVRESFITMMFYGVSIDEAVELLAV